MTNPAHTPNESSTRTAPYQGQEFDTPNAPHTSTKGDVIKLSDYQTDGASSIPGFRPLSQVIADSEKREDRRHALEKARQRLSTKLYPNEGTTLRTLRLNRGWSQASLAKRLGTSQSHIARIEHGNDDIRLSTCRKLCEVFDIDMNALDLAFQAQANIADK